MQIEILSDSDAVAKAAAERIAAAARAACDERGRFVLAVSGGATPWQMLRLLGQEPLAWQQIHIVQVDERVAPPGDLDRNLTHLGQSLLQHAPIATSNIHAMPVESPDLEGAARLYARTLAELCGTPPVIDLVHLGLGPDGHTASLVPDDPVLLVDSADVAITGLYQGRHRMTLTYPTINRARAILWLVTGGSKVDMLPRLRDADPGIPAGRVRQEQATVLADRAAAQKVE